MTNLEPQNSFWGWASEDWGTRGTAWSGRLGRARRLRLWGVPRPRTMLGRSLVTTTARAHLERDARAWQFTGIYLS